MKKILLSGYFGFDNLGDEAILYSMIKKFKEIEDIEIIVLSSNPQKTMNKFGVKAVDRMKLSAVFKEIKRCDLFISGGGSLLQDITSKRSVYYYLALIFIAKIIFNKKVMIYSQGIGPLNDEKNRKNVASLFNKLDLINVRDEDSKVELQKMGVQKEIFVTADTVFTIDDVSTEFGNEKIKELGISDKKIVGISVRKWKDYDEKIISNIKKFIDSADEKFHFVLLPFHRSGDLEISKKIIEECKSQNVSLLEEELNEIEMLSVIKNTDIMLSMRLHGVIFASVCHSYPIFISYDPKLDSLSKEMGIEEIIDVRDIDYKKLLSFLYLVDKNEDDKRKYLMFIRNKMKDKALVGIDFVKGLLM